MSTKASLRKVFTERRLQLTLQEMHSMTAIMMTQMEAIPWPHGKTLMSYKPMAKRKEIPIHFFEQSLLHFKKHIDLCYPRTQIADCTMEAVLDEDETEWTLSSFHVEEPVNGTVVPPEKISIVFVPLIAFDEQGYRVGYGKGFYDRFLKQCNADVLSIGFSWFGPVAAIEDINANDVPLKYCITPHKLYAF
jgi:5-formyltetrahydrofolate cyclo-ligase